MEGNLGGVRISSSDRLAFENTSSSSSSSSSKSNGLGARAKHACWLARAKRVRWVARAKRVRWGRVRSTRWACAKRVRLPASTSTPYKRQRGERYCRPPVLNIWQSTVGKISVPFI